MKTKLAIVGLLVVAFSMAPTVAAHHADDESTLAVPLSDTGEANDLYVTDAPAVWEETNGHDGLQTTETSFSIDSADECAGDAEEAVDTDEDGDVDTCIVAPDSQFELPAPPV